MASVIREMQINEASIFCVYSLSLFEMPVLGLNFFFLKLVFLKLTYSSS